MHYSWTAGAFIPFPPPCLVGGSCPHQKSASPLSGETNGPQHQRILCGEEAMGLGCPQLQGDAACPPAQPAYTYVVRPSTCPAPQPS